MNTFVDTFVKQSVKMDHQTENQIKEKAKILFFSKGMLNASTQEIADYVGVNRTLVNYYFRSKKNLFHVLYNETILEMRNGFDSIYSSDVPFRQKVEDLIDFVVSFREKYPFIEVFNIQETGKLTNQLTTIVQPIKSEHIDLFLKEVEVEMKKGTIPTHDPVNFLINLISLTSYPVIMKPIFDRIFNIDSDLKREEIYGERKEIILTILFN